MARNEAFEIRVRKSPRNLYMWMAYYISANSVKAEIDCGWKNTENAAWLAGIKTVKAFQRQTEKEHNP